jgi:hypothetical protein
MVVGAGQCLAGAEYTGCDLAPALPGSPPGRRAVDRDAGAGLAAGGPSDRPPAHACPASSGRELTAVAPPGDGLRLALGGPPQGKPPKRSGSGQSCRRGPGTMGQAPPQPMVISPRPTAGWDRPAARRNGPRGAFQRAGGSRVVQSDQQPAAAARLFSCSLPVEHVALMRSAVPGRLHRFATVGAWSPTWTFCTAL